MWKRGSIGDPFIGIPSPQQPNRLEKNMATLDKPDTGPIAESLIRDLTGSGSPWAVIVFNDEEHTFDDVAYQLQKAIGCTLEQGYAYANTVDAEGQARVFEGELDRCERVAAVLEEIRLKVKLQVQ